MSSFFKNSGHRYNNLMVLLINSWGSLLVSQEHIKQRSKQRQWMRKTDGMGSYYSIINDLRLTDNEVLESTYKWIHQHMCRFKVKIMCFYFFFTVQVDTVYQNVLCNSYLFLFYIMEFRKQKNIFYTSEAS